MPQSLTPTLLQGNVVIPTVHLKTPLDPFLIRPWVKVTDVNWGDYYYNAETGM